MDKHPISAVRGALCALLFGSTLSLAAAPASPYSNLFVLGDSISDSGNVKNVYDAAVAANGGVPPTGLGPRIPPDISTSTSSSPTTRARSPALLPRPNAASRSTRWIHSAPCCCQVNAAASGSP